MVGTNIRNVKNVTRQKTYKANPVMFIFYLLDYVKAKMTDFDLVTRTCHE